LVSGVKKKAIIKNVITYFSIELVPILVIGFRKLKFQVQQNFHERQSLVFDVYFNTGHYGADDKHMDYTKHDQLNPQQSYAIETGIRVNQTSVRSCHRLQIERFTKPSGDNIIACSESAANNMSMPCFTQK